jgi:hypothetical protein
MKVGQFIHEVMRQNCFMHQLTAYWKLIYFVPLITLLISFLVVWLTPNSVHNSRYNKKDKFRIIVSTFILYFYGVWILMWGVVKPVCYFTGVYTPPVAKVVAETVAKSATGAL